MPEVLMKLGWTFRLMEVGRMPMGIKIYVGWWFYFFLKMAFAIISNTYELIIPT